jgi:hypothetical protein
MSKSKNRKPTITKLITTKKQRNQQGEMGKQTN